MKQLTKQFFCFHKWVELPKIIKFQKYFFTESECKKCNKIKIKIK